MKSFIVKCLLFGIPIALFFLLFFGVFFLDREYLPLSTIINRQQQSQSNILYLPESPKDSEWLYKLISAKREDPEIIVLGTSRSVTFQSGFFKDPTVFYNSGGVTLNANDMYEYVKDLSSDSKLKLILLDLSGYLKIDSPDALGTDIVTSYNPLTFFLTSGWHDIYTDYLNGRFSIGALIQASGEKDNQNIGLDAILHRAGFRKDGSLDRGTTEEIQTMQEGIPSEISYYTSIIKAGQESSLDYGASLSESNLAGIDKLLALCKSKNIYVIGYLSPYAVEMYDALESEQNSYGETYRNAPSVIQPLFMKYKYDFYDVRNLTAIGSSDSELYDSEHPTEKSTIRLLIYLAEREPKLSAYVDIPTLEQKIISQPF